MLRMTKPAAPTPPKTGAQRQAALRANRAEKGLTQVGGIFAHPEDHPAIKAYAAKLTAKRGKGTKP